jgi:isoleucyl-tRNA synthetase
MPSALDRWILGELALTTREVTQRMDRYEVYESAQALIALVESLSNWYVRRSRDRFWAAGDAESTPDKRDAYGTLHDVLVGIAELSAPFVPFLAEEMYRGLVAAPFGDQAPPSVHLRDYPTADEDAIDLKLSRDMADARAVVSLGLQVRTQSKIKVRQPLAMATVVVSGAQREGLEKNRAVIAEELNVNRVEFVSPDQAEQFVTFKLKPNFRTLGARIGKHVQAVKKALEEVNAGALRAELVTKGKAIVPGVSIEGAPLEVGPEDVEVQVLAREGFAAAGDRVGVVVLDIAITQDLKESGWARELLNRLQTIRKELGLAYDDRVRVNVTGPRDLVDALSKPALKTLVMEATLCRELRFGIEGDTNPTGVGGHPREIEIDGQPLTVTMTKVQPGS